MKIKKIFSVVLAFLLCLGSLSIIAYADGIEKNTDFIDTPTLPPVEEIEVTVVFRPLESLISFAGFGPVFDGTVLKITYPDGETETVTVQTNWTGLSAYVAGKYNVYTDYFETQEIKSPGINKKKFVLHGMKDLIEYEGSCNLDYLYIPSLTDFFYLVDAYVRILFS